MIWLFTAIIAYFFLALVNVGDKFLIDRKIKSPATYTFYIGAALVVFLLVIPFIDFEILAPIYIFMALVSGFLFNYSLFWMYKAIQKTDVSVAIPAYGALLPIFTFLLAWFFAGQILTSTQIVAFVLLICGSLIINYKQGGKVDIDVFKICAIGIFFLSLSLFLSKYVYLASPNFLSNFIWIKMGGILTSVVFYFGSEKVRTDVYSGLSAPQAQNVGLFFMVQSAGATSNVLQNFSIALAPIALISIINALQGIQYVFLFLFTFWLARKFPEKFHDDYSKPAMTRKIIAMLIIFIGLGIISFS